MPTRTTAQSQPKRGPAKSWRDAAIRRVLALMRIPGRSGDELAVADFVRQELLAAGAKSHQIVTDTAHKKAPIKGNTGNLIFQLPGSIRGPRRMLVAHLDTVPVCVGSKPVRNKNIVHSGNPAAGLGADDRAGVAVTLTTATEILKHDLPRPPLCFLWSVQEETGLHGARLVSVSKLKRPSLSFNWDGGDPTKLTIGATGGYRMKIVIHGKAAHAGNVPEHGVSAISIAAYAIAELTDHGWHGQIVKRESQGTSNVGVIQGGLATNVVADRVVVQVEARSHDPAFRKRIVSEIQRAFVQAARRVQSDDGTTGNIEFDGRLDYESFCIPPDSPVVAEAQLAIESLGLEPQLAVANGGLDANWLTAHGMPTVSMGCGQKNQHMVTESLDLDEYLTGCEVAMRLATAGGR